MVNDDTSQRGAPLASPPRRSAFRWIAWLAVGLSLAIGSAVYYWRPTSAPPPVLPEAVGGDDDLDSLLAVQNPGYVGPDACTPCHSARVATFRATSHMRACRTPRNGPMPPGFAPGRGSYKTRDPGLRFEMTASGGEFFATGIQTTPKGTRRATSPVHLVYGASKADEVFFSWRGDHLHELMVVWLHPMNCWANTSYDRYGSGDFARATTTRCLECHNTWFEHVPGTVNQYRRDSFILGVTCERCHGPGRDHAEFHRANPEDHMAHAVVNPRRLSREQRIEVCTQCHGNVTKPRGPTFSYRPGEPLEAHFRAAVTAHPEQDHVANQVKYLRQSKCFQKSDDLTCVTCHDPHRPHEPGGNAAVLVRKSCLRCHEPAACTDRPRLPTPVRDDCIGCHMPQQVWMNVHFHTEDDRYVPPIRRYQHRIAVDPIARASVLLDWHRTQPGGEHRKEADRLTEELVEHWLAEGEKRRREYRFLAAIGTAREALRLNPAPPARAKVVAALGAAVGVQAQLDADLVEALHEISERRPPSAIRTLNKILTVKPDWAIVHSKLGTLYAATGQNDLAVKHLEAVARCDPDDASGLSMLGWMAYIQGRPADAVEAYRQAEQIEPFDAKINYHWGLSLLKLGRWPQAADRFRRTVAIDPRHAGGYQGLSHALREESQFADAVRFGRRAARLTEFEQTDVLVTLAEAYAGAGRTAEAADIADKALSLDTTQPGGVPGLGPEVRRRMEALRARTAPSSGGRAP